MENAKISNPTLSTILLHLWITNKIKNPLAFRELHLFLVDWEETKWENKLVDTLPEEILLAMPVTTCIDAYRFWEILTYVQAHLDQLQQKELLSYLQSRGVELKL